MRRIFERVRVRMGSAGSLPAVLGSLPSTNGWSDKIVELRFNARRQAADDGRLAACAPHSAKILI
jgi:hypothetical protein